MAAVSAGENPAGVPEVNNIGISHLSAMRRRRYTRLVLARVCLLGFNITVVV